MKNFRGEKLLSDVQIRRIVNELQKKIEDFDDNYYRIPLKKATGFNHVDERGLSK
jgi:hypothetical protein